MFLKLLYAESSELRRSSSFAREVVSSRRCDGVRMYLYLSSRILLFTVEN